MFFTSPHCEKHIHLKFLSSATKTYFCQKLHQLGKILKYYLCLKGFAVNTVAQYVDGWLNAWCELLKN